ncbi:Glutathione import ATP-binding protein GsiA [Raoultella terrigena]|uniref:Glutathione import ATP-binding protein GsiA n=1 Tax=Raoultella terrigena TaxID=577 RepID=A0A4U9D224_RAOTE|nr:Glutathione import ATP-binding protein GsiA [Raoultella terrigena]
MSIIETAKAPQAQQQSGLLLDVKDLRVTFKTPDGDVTAVNDLNFNLRAGETLGIVGESGSGKSQTAFALMGLLAANGYIGGSATFNGRQILNLPERELNKLARRADFDDFPGPDDLSEPVYAGRRAADGGSDAAQRAGESRGL